MEVFVKLFSTAHHFGTLVRDLFSRDFDPVFIDTTSRSVYRDTENDRFKRDYSRKHRPDLPQTVLCVIVNAYGWPVTWEVYPGNTADVVAMEKMSNRLRKRPAIPDVVVWPIGA